MKPPGDLVEMTDQAEYFTKNAGSNEWSYGIGTRGSRSWATIHPGFMSAYANYGLVDFENNGGKLKAAMNSQASKDFHKQWVKMISSSGPANWSGYTWYEVGNDIGAGASAMIFDADILGYFFNGNPENKEAGNFGFHGFTPNPSASAPTPNVWIWVHPGESPLSALRKGSWLKTEEELVERAFSLLKFLKLDHLWDRPAGTLSGGQMKLLEIGRALMTRPKMIVMDEPVAGVAPSLAHDILQKLVELKKEGITVLLIEHRLDIVLGYVDHLYVMFNGRILTEGRGKEGIERVVNDPRVAEIYMGG
jgi:branched-chain amino acid transport system ATP-binding protein